VGSEESVSGPGSTRARGESFRDDVIALLRTIGARTLLDAPCGDFNWMDSVADAVNVGVDIVDVLIERNARVHGGERRTFLCRDFTRDPLPRADVILCRAGALLVRRRPRGAAQLPS